MSRPIKGFISITKTYEIECSVCGLLDQQSTRDKAEVVLTNHRKSHNGARGWFLGKSWGSSSRMLVKDRMEGKLE